MLDTVLLSCVRMEPTEDSSALPEVDDGTGMVLVMSPGLLTDGLDDETGVDTDAVTVA